jgi:CBS domain-containing protein
MELTQKANRIVITIWKDARQEDESLCDAVLRILREEGVPGAIVTAGREPIAAAEPRDAIARHGAADGALIIEWFDEPDQVATVLGRLASIVPEGCILVEQAELVSCTRSQLGQGPGEVTVRDWMTCQVRAVTPDLPAAMALTLFEEDGLRVLPVIDQEQHVIGLLTEGSLLAHLRLGEPGNLLDGPNSALRDGEPRVGDIMTRDPLTVADDAMAQEAARLMAEKGLKRLPVVNRAGQLIGMISQHDLLWPHPHHPIRRPPDRHFGFIAS